MPGFLKTLVASAAVALALSACSGSTQSGCTQPPIASYPPVTLASPANGATGVSVSVGNLIVESTGSQLYGTLTVTGGGNTYTLNPQAVANSNGQTQFEGHLPVLKPGTTYHVLYTLTYPGGCQGPSITKVQSAGSFTTGA